jgi:hypothetical protein
MMIQDITDTLDHVAASWQMGGAYFQPKAIIMIGFMIGSERKVILCGCGDGTQLLLD